MQQHQSSDDGGGLVPWAPHPCGHPPPHSRGAGSGGAASVAPTGARRVSTPHHGRGGALYCPLLGCRDDELCTALASAAHSPEAWCAALWAVGGGLPDAVMVSIRQLRVLIWRQTERWIAAGHITGRPDVVLTLTTPAETRFIFHGPGTGPPTTLHVSVRNWTCWLLWLRPCTSYRGQGPGGCPEHGECPQAGRWCYVRRRSPRGKLAQAQRPCPLSRTAAARSLSYPQGHLPTVVRDYRVPRTRSRWLPRHPALPGSCGVLCRPPSARPARRAVSLPT